MLRAAGVTAATSLTGCLLNNDQVAGGHLYVENFLPNDYRVSITVVRGREAGGERIIDGWFRIPVDHALLFEAVIEAGMPYMITVHRPDVAPEDRVTATIPTCEANGGSARDVSVRVRADGTGIIPWGCDQDYTRRKLEYVEASEYAIDPPAAADPTATESTSTES